MPHLVTKVVCLGMLICASGYSQISEQNPPKMGVLEFFRLLDAAPRDPEAAYRVGKEFEYDEYPDLAKAAGYYAMSARYGSLNATYRLGLLIEKHAVRIPDAAGVQQIAPAVGRRLVTYALTHGYSPATDTVTPGNFPFDFFTVILGDTYGAQVREALLAKTRPLPNTPNQTTNHSAIPAPAPPVDEAARRRARQAQKEYEDCIRRNEMNNYDLKYYTPCGYSDHR